MFFADWAFILYAIYVSFIILLYVLELIVIIKNEKNAFDTSFYHIFVVLALVDITACLLWCFLSRFPLYPIVNGFYQSLLLRRWWISTIYSVGYYLNCVSQHMSVLLAINRFSALYFPNHHDKVWRIAIYPGVLLCALIAIVPVSCLIGSPIEFFELPGEKSGFSWFYLVGQAESQAAIWFNMTIVTVVCNGCLSILYGACVVRICFFSVKRFSQSCDSAENKVLGLLASKSPDRTKFLPGGLLVYDLQSSLHGGYVVPAPCLNGKPPPSPESIVFVAFQLPWLTDLKYLSPAPLLLLTKAIRTAIKAIFSNNTTRRFSVFSTAVTQITHVTNVI